MEFPLPVDEESRLSVLKSFKILDTPPERAFDDLAELTRYICGTPIAFLGLMDADRLWLKSKVGWDVTQVPRAMSFCAHTILQSDVLVVPDTLADKNRLGHNPLTTIGGMRFYAGMSLMSAEGYALGTLSAMDSIPRALTLAQTEALRRLGHVAVALLESRRQSKDVLEGAQTQTHPRFSGAKNEAVLDPAESPERTPDKRVLQQGEQRLQSIIASAMDAIITIDSNQKIILFNKAAEQVFRCSASEALGKSIEKFIPEKFRSAHHQHIEQFGETGVSSRSMDSLRMLYAVRADGEQFPMEATISQCDLDREKLFTVIVRDITVRVRMEAQLRHAQKVEAVGQLAGGIAHEFNNFLGVVLGYSELLEEEAAANARVAQFVKDIKTATKHAASLTRQLLAFGRKQVPEPQSLNINQCIWECHNLLRRLVPANIEVVPSLGEKVGMVKADAGQIQRILINLVVNARDAMPQGGRVVIETAEVELDASYARQHVDVTPGQYVLLSISDTGIGMNQEIRSHLFEPFFSTKEPGKGTGLGLSTVFGIVRNSGGHISIESAEGKGTAVRIYLPRISEISQAVRNAVTQGRSPASTRPSTILVVEDEAALRYLICTSLERCHHRVFVAKDGAEALSTFQQHAMEIKIIVSDLMMPRMDGFELKKQISATNAEVKFLFMSGYAEHAMDQHHESLSGCAFLEKPFLPRELANRVDDLLRADIAA